MVTRTRILFVAKNLQQGGTERQILRIIRALDPTRFEAALCTLDPERHYDDEGCGARRYSFEPRHGDAADVIATCIDDFRPDVVHSFRDVVNRGVHAALARTEHQPAWLASVRGRPMLPADLLGTFRLHRRAYRITVNSIGIRQTLRRFARVPAAKIVVIPNLVDVASCERERPRAPDRAAARAALRLPGPAGFVWVLPGRLSWVKNQLGLVCALALLKVARSLPRDAIVVLAGRVRDRLPARLIGPLGRLLGVARHLRYVGSLRDVSALYAAADALVLPSWAEGMPNVVLEAQLAGLPVVVTRQGNRDGLVRDGESGFEVTTGSPLSLARALARVMALSSLGRRRMGQRGRAQLLETHAPGPIVERMQALYEQAARARGAGAHGGMRSPTATAKPTATRTAIVQRMVLRRSISAMVGGRDLREARPRHARPLNGGRKIT